MYRPLFYVRRTGRYDLLAVADEPQSASKRALGDIDMFNTGFLASRAAPRRVACDLFFSFFSF